MITNYNGQVGRVITTGSIIAEPIFEYQLRLNRLKRLRTAANGFCIIPVGEQLPDARTKEPRSLRWSVMVK